MLHVAVCIIFIRLTVCGSFAAGQTGDLGKPREISGSMQMILRAGQEGQPEVTLGGGGYVWSSSP